jgi:hypothetical protein
VYEDRDVSPSEDRAAGSSGLSVNFYKITGFMKTTNIFTMVLRPFLYFQLTYLFLDLLYILFFQLFSVL